MTLLGHVLTAIISLLALLLLFAIGISAFALPAIDFGPLDHTYNLTIENQIYPIRYGFSSDRNGTAVIESMSADYSSKLIQVRIDDNSTATEKKFFMIELPRNVINSNSTQLAGGCTYSFTANTPPLWVQEHDIDYYVVVIMISKSNTTFYHGSVGELCDRDTRTLSIDYPTGKSMIVIQGTTMIPEFDLSRSVLIITGIVGAIGVSMATNHISRRNHT